MENICLYLVSVYLSVFLNVKRHKCRANRANESLPLFMLEQGNYFQNLKLLANI